MFSQRLEWCLKFVFLAAGLALTGCQTLLPRASSEVRDTWASFDEARDAIDRIVPYETRRAQLAAQGLEPGKNPAITLLSFADVSQRFTLGSTVTADELDRGLHECFAAGKRCTGYSIARCETQAGRKLLARRLQFCSGHGLNRLELQRVDSIC